MKVVGIEAFVVPSAVSNDDWCRGKDFVLVKVKTDAAINGWGEAYSGLHDCEPGLLSLIGQVGRYADGLDPFRVKRFLITVYAHFEEAQRSKAFFAAVSAIEIALWDIAGKALGVPVHRLLGGTLRDRIEVYANCWSHRSRSVEELVAYAKSQVEKGYGSIKVYPFLYMEDIDAGAIRLAALREALGPGIDILVDAWMLVDIKDTVEIADTLRRNGVWWFEDPVAPDDVEKLAEINQTAQLTIVSGENLCTKSAFRVLLERGAADILHPDTTLCGGILEVKEISVLAELFSVRVAIHNYNSMGVGLAASLQIAALIPNLVKVEHFPRFVAPSAKFTQHVYEIEGDGCIGLSEAPGLGVEVDETALADLSEKRVTV
jgi:galactonate dehydratase